MNRFAPILFALAAVPAPTAVFSAAQAGPLHHSTKLQIYFAGIPVGKLKLNIDLDGDQYQLIASGKTTGVSKIIADTKGSIKSAGRQANGKIDARTHVLNFKSGKKSGYLSMVFAGGDLKKLKSSPKIRYGKGALPLKAKHFKSVLDPAGAALIPVRPSQIDNGPAICNRTLPIFDGKFRFNIRMQYKGQRKRKVKGFNGRTFVCRLKYEPIAGHRPFKKNVQFMQANKDIEIAVARLGTSNTYGLIDFSVLTRFGRVTGTPYKFVTTQK